MHIPAPQPSTSATAALGATSEYLSFRLGPVEYGIDILKVQEIRSYAKPTHIANAPDEWLGVINLRGVIVPIIDLRLKLHCATAAYTATTVVVVLNLEHQVIGVVVDAVSDVVQLEPACVQPAPTLHPDADVNAITGLANLGERMLVLLDTEALLGKPDTSAAAVH